MKSYNKLLLIIFVFIVEACKADINNPEEYEYKEYTITYILNDGINNPANPAKYIAGTATTLLAPSRNDYTFEGWFEKEDFSGDVICTIPVNSKKNIVLYAKWKKNSKNDGSSEQDFHKHDFSTTWSSDENYHWHKAICEHGEELSNLEKHIYDNGCLTQSPSTENMGIYTYTCEVCGYKKNMAVEKLTRHSFVLNEPSIVVNDYEKYRVYKNSYKCSNCGITCSHYTFANVGLNKGMWAAIKSGLESKYFYENHDYDNKCKEQCSAFSGECKLLGELFSITYILNGGYNNQSNPSNYSVGSAVRLQEPSKSECKFCGWYEYVDFSGSIVTMIDSSAYGNKVYYAKWEYSINYNLNSSYYDNIEYNAQNNINNPSSYSGQETVKIYEPTRKGFLFDGWYTDYNCTSIPISNIPAGSRGEIHLYAKWKIIEYPIEYELNNGINNGSNKTFYTIEDFDDNSYGSYKNNTISINLLEPERDGYSFLGWYTESNLSGNPCSFINLQIDKIEIQQIKLYAGWIENYIKISFSAPVYNDIQNLSDPIISGTTISFTAPDIYKQYSWFLDSNDDIQCSTKDFELDINSSCLSNGYHIVELEVTGGDDNIYSATYEFEVQR